MEEADTLRNDDEYAAAIGELETLLLSEPDTPAGRRFNELVALIEEFDARRGGYELLRGRRASA
jgi:antitoxin component HigA of HigAB toxin-antitoxin module